MVSAMAVSLAIAAVPTPASEEPTPSELLASTSAAYRDLNAFDVTGVVDSALIDDHGQVGPLLFGHRDFTCFYSAPEAFVFSMVHRGSADYKPWSLVLAINGANATLAAPPALETETSDVPKALSGASSITSQASSLLVGLLLPNAESGFQLSELSEAHIDGTEVIRDVPCWRVSGKFSARGRDATLWVSKAESFVLRVVLSYAASGGAVHRHNIEFTSLHALRAGEKSMVAVPLGTEAR